METGQDDRLFRHLRDVVFPALLEASPGEDPAALLWRLALGAAAAIASKRGLALPGKVDPALLAGLDLDGADVRLPGRLYAALRGGRRTQGSYYTPAALASQVAAWTLDASLESGAAPRVLDPALGAGHFLLAAAERIAGALRRGDSAPGEQEARWRALAALYGVDIDPRAVMLARLTLWLWAAVPGTMPEQTPARLVCADALLDENWPDALGAPFDAVVSNPPFTSVFTRARDAESEALREAIQARYATATGSFDLAVPFVERAISLLREGGRAGFVLPNKLLSADYAAALREWLGRRAAVEVIGDYARVSSFDAGVYPAAVVLRKGVPGPAGPLELYRAHRPDPVPVLLRKARQADLAGAPGAVWSGVLDPAWDVLRVCFDGAVPLGERAEISAGLTVAEAYDLRDRVIDAPLGVLPGDAVMLATSGLVERYGLCWGRKETRYLNRRYACPIIKLRALPARRREQARRSKLIVAGLGLHPQAAVDAGLAQASVATLIVSGADWPLPALCAWLNSTLAARLYRALYGGLALSGGYLRFGRRELARLPLPDAGRDDPRVARLEALGSRRARTNRQEAGELEAEIDAVVCALYGIEMGALDSSSQP